MLITCLTMSGCLGSTGGTATPTAGVNSDTPTAGITNGPTDGTTDGPTDGTTTNPVTDSPTQEITLEPTVPTDPSTGPTVSHAPVSKWDYTFTYGTASIKCTALTRFNDGTKGSGDGSFSFSNSGLLIKQSNGSYADTYAIYTGANLLSADYSKVKYVGITVENNESHDIYFGLQGSDKNNKSIFLYPNGDPIALAYDNGKTIAADGQEGINGRYCIVIPGNFKGSVLIPINRIADNHITADAKLWAKTPIAKVGFHLSDSGTKGILVKAMFLCNTALAKPGQGASGIQNENYSYTNEQRIVAFWKQGTMYNESMAMIQQSDGSIYGTLLFVPTKINAIVDVYLKKEYKAGVDFEWVKGTNKIKWLKGSSIPYFTENDLSGKDANGKNIAEFPTWSGNGQSRFGNCLYCVSSFLYEKQIAVSYTYNTSQVASQGIKYTSYQGTKLKNTVSKLSNNKDLKVLFYGDSIFSGCDASSMYNRAPYMPYMHKMIEAELQKQTRGTVTVDNLSVGGWTVENGRDALSGNVGGYNYSNDYKKGYDLLILSFGMNNGTTPMTDYKAATKAIVDKVRAANPNMEVILVSCMNPNPRVGWDVQQKNQGTALKEIAAESKYASYTATVDFYAVHKSILKYKNYASTTGNNINHPNDWLIRVYAQNILAAIIK